MPGVSRAAADEPEHEGEPVRDQGVQPRVDQELEEGRRGQAANVVNDEAPGQPGRGG